MNNWKTEEEARETWCPHQKDDAWVIGGQCIASGCAMWVWKPKLDLKRALERYLASDSNVNSKHVRNALADMESPDELGRCGLIHI